MAAIEFTCSQCLYSGAIEAGSRFCPRCGLPIEPANAPADPVTLPFAGTTITTRNRLAFGDLCNVYCCDIGHEKLPGVFKIARSHLANKHVAREMETLRRLHQADIEGRFIPFLPKVVGTIQVRQSTVELARSGSVLSYFEDVSPDEFYSLEEVRGAYPAGIDARDMAWIWRRLLTVLGFVHTQHLAHGAVTPDHLLIEPRGHKLLLIGWSAAAPFGMLPHLAPPRWRERTSAVATGELRPCSAESDLACAARSMSYILGNNVEPAITRHLQRASESSDAWRLLADFDKMIEVLWGPKRFRAFSMPPRV
jgi:serine/threonine protein kinase